MKGAAAALTFSPVTVTVVPPLYENIRRALATENVGKHDKCHDIHLLKRGGGKPTFSWGTVYPADT